MRVIYPHYEKNKVDIMRRRAGTDVLPKKREGGKNPGKIELDLKKKKKAANLSSRIPRSWMTSLTVDDSEKYF